ncbi:hypothetical protein [Reyranella soli]|uniref:Bacteriophage/plasmid primase P4 C-terminal domain-containing protein n=1 Tax=Reyranella soli TaxID=1230389 RepID=A0A512NKJ0_9HYPH|nr:hypothetical protein [Reyranella soli]GEP59463.1 hypothetical protein RSO01_66290 [Reyranella soli]
MAEAQATGDNIGIVLGPIDDERGIGAYELEGDIGVIRKTLARLNSYVETMKGGYRAFVLYPSQAETEELSREGLWVPVTGEPFENFDKLRQIGTEELAEAEKRALAVASLAYKKAQSTKDQDYDLAKLFARGMVGSRWRYVAKWGQWLRWNDKVWETDEKLTAQDEVGAYCSGLGIGSAKRVFAVLSMLKGVETTAAVHDQWDTNIWVLGTPGGTIQLKEGEAP